MIRIEDNQINVYTKVDKEEIKDAIVCFFIAFVIAIVLCIIFKNLFFVILSGISLFALIIAYCIYKKDFPERLRFSLSKKEFIIYKKRKNEIFDNNKITGFFVVPNQSGFENYINVNYINEKGKEASALFQMRGSSNIEFVNLANSYLNKEEIKKEIKETDNSKYNKDNSGKILKELTKTKEKIEFTLVGKTKIFILNGSGYSLQTLYPYLIFVDSNNNILEVLAKDVILNWNEIDSKYTYELVYDRKKDKLIAEKTNNLANQNIVNDFKEDFIYSSKLLFKKEEIISESTFLKKYMKILKSFGLAILLSLFTIFISGIVFSILFALIIIVFGIVLLMYPKKYLKENHIKK